MDEDFISNWKSYILCLLFGLLGVHCLLSGAELHLVVAGVARAEDEEAVPGLVVKTALQRAVVL